MRESVVDRVMVDDAGWEGTICPKPCGNRHGKDWRMGLGRARTERTARRGLAARFGATGRDTIAARAEDMTAEAILLGGEVGATGRDLL